MVAEWQRHSVPPDFLRHSMVREVSPPATDGAELAVTPLSLIEGGGVGIVLSLCDTLWLLSFARDPPKAIFGHCFRARLQAAITQSISYGIFPKFVNSISSI